MSRLVIYQVKEVKYLQVPASKMLLVTVLYHWKCDIFGFRLLSCQNKQFEVELKRQVKNYPTFWWSLHSFYLSKNVKCSPFPGPEVWGLWAGLDLARWHPRPFSLQHPPSPLKKWNTVCGNLQILSMSCFFVLHPRWLWLSYFIAYPG